MVTPGGLFCLGLSGHFPLSTSLPPYLYCSVGSRGAPKVLCSLATIPCVEDRLSEFAANKLFIVSGLDSTGARVLSSPMR